MKTINIQPIVTILLVASLVFSWVALIRTRHDTAALLRHRAFESQRDYYNGCYDAFNGKITRDEAADGETDLLIYQQN